MGLTSTNKTEVSMVGEPGHGNERQTLPVYLLIPKAFLFLALLFYCKEMPCLASTDSLQRELERIRKEKFIIAQAESMLTAECMKRMRHNDSAAWVLK